MSDAQFAPRLRCWRRVLATYLPVAAHSWWIACIDLRLSARIAVGLSMSRHRSNAPWQIHSVHKRRNYSSGYTVT